MVHVSYLILASEEYERFMFEVGFLKIKNFFQIIISLISCELIDKQDNFLLLS